MEQVMVQLWDKQHHHGSKTKLWTDWRLGLDSHVKVVLAQPAWSVCDSFWWQNLHDVWPMHRAIADLGLSWAELQQNLHCNKHRSIREDSSKTCVSWADQWKTLLHLQLVNEIEKANAETHLQQVVSQLRRRMLTVNKAMAKTKPAWDWFRQH